MPQNINLNISPYYDDFSQDKNYYKVLFKPGTSIQSRELTTLQSILQNQIEKFGQHFFKDGAMVIPGNIAFDSNYTCVEINSIHLGIPVVEYLQNLVGKIIKGQTSNIIAKIENVIDENGSDRKNNTLYIKYQSSSQSDFNSNTFIDGENLIIQEDIEYSLGLLKQNNTIATTISNNCNSIGSAAKISSGVYFIRGFFLNIDSETLILDQYNNLPSYRVGLLIKESFATASNEYSDLLDNSKGFYNFAAPGADRLVIQTQLIKKSLDDFNDDNFVQLIRVENGILERIVRTTDYNIFQDELARRTYDESGDYYIRPFDIEIKESLNDYIGNNGIYKSTQLTKQGNIPSKDLACISISPGKAYIRGYEVESISNTIIDLDKTRTTDTTVNEVIQFNFGTQIELNNVYGHIPVGYGTDSYVKLYGSRTDAVGVSTGLQIGVAKLYDLKLKSSGYVNESSIFTASLYDIQTYTTLDISSGLGTVYPQSTFIEGKNSGANGYLVSGITSISTQFDVYQVSGNFIKNEALIINGLENNKIIKNVLDYGLTDLYQITSYDTNPATFTADTVLSRKINLSNNQAPYTITRNILGISTITTSNNNFYSNIKVNDIISYTKENSTLPTYNLITTVDSNTSTATISSLTSVPYVNDGTLPTSNIVVNDLRKITSSIEYNNKSLYSRLNSSYISTVDLTNSSITLRKTLDKITITDSSIFEVSVFEGALDSFLVPFDEEAYTLVYADGTVEKLESQSLIPNYDASNYPAQGRITLRNLSQVGDAYLTITYQKINCKTRKKSYNRCEQLTINNTNSGINTVGTGLIYSEVYGRRIEDNIISLNVSDVNSIIAIFESSNEDAPILPSININVIAGDISNLIKGEKIISSDGQTSATLIDNNSTLIKFAYLGQNTFKNGEIVTFEESGITAVITNIVVGDRNIINSYLFDTGSRDSYLDYSRIVRKSSNGAPKKQITIIYNYYSIDSNDNGTFVAVNSYDLNLYDQIPYINFTSCSDILDFRPRVSPYNTLSKISPFEFESRNFNANVSSCTSIVAKNSSTLLSYNYYLPRIDKLFLSRYGSFTIIKGIPSLYPKLPETLDYSLEVATLYLPPYVQNVSDIRVVTNKHKRYTMKDISLLDNRISNVEYYTALSLLETETQNLTITDPDTNLNRFKCGFFVDNFSSYNGGDIQNKLYRASVDSNNNILRPQSYTTYIDLEFNSNNNSNVRKVGDVVCLNYSDVIYVQNKFATRVENVNPFNVISWSGNIELKPSSDTWVEPRITTRTETIEGDYAQTINELKADSNTGLSPEEWGAWETTWTGSPISTRESSRRALTSSRTISEVTESIPGGSNRNISPFSTLNRPQIATTSVVRDTFTNFSTVTTSTPTNQSRSGIQNKVTERFDSRVVGDRVVSKNIITTIRSRNIGIISKRLKPNTQFYGFFDGVDLTNYIVPKLIEIEMVSGTFTSGEDVSGNLGTSNINFRLANQNHKYGLYNSPNETFTNSPYDITSRLPSNYSSSSVILNVDTESLELQSESQYYGYISINMLLVGQSSGAIARVKNIRLITDSSGTFLGSIFIPDPSTSSNPRFTTGTKTFVLTTSLINSNIVGSVLSSGEASFTSSGIIENIEEHTLRIRNATVERVPLSQSITGITTTTFTETSTSFVDRTITNTSFIDPLAQSFEVTDRTGIYITKCDIYFKTKDLNGIPITLQVRTMQSGFPTQKILPFGEVILEPESISISENGATPTTFTFSSPIYLEGGNEYSIVLISASNEYTVWISRMGEEDITTLNVQDGNKVIVSQQPTLGSLFKSQNASTWDASQYEDLKFNLYRADFTTQSGSAVFYNPILGVGNRQIATLRPNPITTYSRSLKLTLNRSLTNSEVQLLKTGYPLTQTSNSTFTSKVKSIVGTITLDSGLEIINPGIGFTSGLVNYSNVDLISLTGTGTGAKINIGIGTGVAYYAYVSDGGNGYTIGDVLTIDYTKTGNLGKELTLTIPNTVGILTTSNSIIIDEVQGNVNTFSGNLIVNNVTFNNAYPIDDVELSDGLHFKVSHNNHGMHSNSNLVRISGIESDVPPTKLIEDITLSSTTIAGEDFSNFITFESREVKEDSPGYIIVNNEIIKYIGVNITSNPNTLTIDNNRGIDDTLPTSHFINDLIFKYEFNSISLRKINKQHSMLNTNNSKYPIELDNYHLKIENDNGKYFGQNKSGGSYLYDQFSLGAYRAPRATQNIMYNILRPLTSILSPVNTEISSKIRTNSGQSIDGNEISFIDRGYEDCSLNSDNTFNDMRCIYSNINELEYLTTSNNKSLALQIQLNTFDSKVSPMIDLERVGMICIMNRIDSPISDYIMDSRVNTLIDDPTSAIYISQLVRLEKPADSLKVLFDAYRHPSNDIRVAYRIFRDDTPDEYQQYQLFPGYANIDSRGNTIDFSKCNGLPDRLIPPSGNESEYKSYEYNMSSNITFTGFQVKIILAGTDQANVPKIRDLRIISTL